MKLFDYLWVLPFFSFLMGYLLLSSLFHVSYVETPALLGKDLNFAAKILSSKNLNFRIIGQKEDNDLPDGTILTQSPPAGQKVRPNQSVFCLISQKMQKNITPQLVNLMHYQCDQHAKKEGFRIKKYPIQSKYPTGLCIGQIPIAGASIENNKNIEIYISEESSSNIVLFPDLKGRLVKEVIEFFKLHTIYPTLLHRSAIELQHECNQCRIIEQKPLAGSLIDLSKPIQVQLQVKER